MIFQSIACANGDFARMLSKDFRRMSEVSSRVILSGTTRAPCSRLLDASRFTGNLCGLLSFSLLTSGDSGTTKCDGFSELNELVLLSSLTNLSSCLFFEKTLRCLDTNLLVSVFAGLPFAICSAAFFRLRCLTPPSIRKIQIIAKNAGMREISLLDISSKDYESVELLSDCSPKLRLISVSAWIFLRR